MCNFDSLLIVGTYTCNSDSEGIYVYMVNSETMEMELNYIAKNTADPSSFQYLSDRKLLIVANEDQEAPYFSCYHVDLEQGKLDFISKIDLPGAGTCDLSVSPDGKWVVGANYHSGSFVWAKMEENGEFTGQAKTIWYHDTSVNPERQTQSYLHGTAFIGNKLHAMNLGGDCIYRYDLNPEDGSLTPCENQPVIWTEKGEGPRHMLIHPNGKWVYLLTEMGNNLIQYEIQDDYSLIELSKAYMLPEHCEIDCRASVLRLSPDGSCLLAAVRDYDALVKFKINPQTGALSDRQFYPTHGEHPRSFEFTLDGRFVMICNQFSNTFTICKFNRKTNEVGEVVKSLEIPGCSYLQMIKRD